MPRLDARTRNHCGLLFRASRSAGGLFARWMQIADVMQIVGLPVSLASMQLFRSTDGENCVCPYRWSYSNCEGCWEGGGSDAGGAFAFSASLFPGSTKCLLAAPINLGEEGVASHGGFGGQLHVGRGHGIKTAARVPCAPVPGPVPRTQREPPPRTSQQPLAAPRGWEQRSGSTPGDPAGHCAGT